MSLLVYAMVRTINCLCDSRQKMARKTSPDYFTAEFKKQYCYKRGTSYSTQGRRSGTCDYSQQEQRLNANRRKWFYWLSWKTDSSEEEIKHRSAKKSYFPATPPVSYFAGFGMSTRWPQSNHQFPPRKTRSINFSKIRQQAKKTHAGKRDSISRFLQAFPMV